jgi:hypothetical protein
MTRRGFEDYDLFQAEVLSSLVKQGADSVATINRELAHEEPEEDAKKLWDAVSSFDN